VVSVARQLEFKQRVHLPMDVPLEPRVARPLNPTYLGAVLWCALVFAGFHGLQRWLARQDLDATDLARARLMIVEKTNPAEPPTPKTSEPIAATAPPAMARPEIVVRPAPAAPSSLLQGGLPDSVAEDEVWSKDAPQEEPDEPEPATVPRAAVAGARASRKARPVRAPSIQSRAVEPKPRVSMSHRDEPPIASWAERTPAPNVSSVVPSPPAAPPSAPLEAGASCEGAIARYSEEINLERPGSTPDISAETYAGLLNNGSYFAHCGIPAHVRVNICAAVQRGRAIGVTVRTNPTQREGERCVRSAVRRLRFPYHPKLDVTRTEFAPN
jgi:hypothetical protein